ncbi:hypothetical protein OU997_00910 [Pseudomonas sp. SL4(2022)]|uniref:hypothetical protein n=1 Tax=Pseudomonas sp. SL4(2022) TaxID=2994661 RepID=UPI00226FE4A8|nr:hypothetical protein [Pseudomonas sp. SL4(2022)]WAC44794.1 hypothetical protein OU997_00910 [Pseudomonas sp. SL4(2022)]
MLTEKEVAQQLADAEASQSLFSFALGGVSLWRLLRAAVGHSLQGLGLQSRGHGGWFQLAKRGMRSLLGVCRALLGSRRLYIVKTYSSALRTRRLYGYSDVYFDEFLEQVPGGSKWSFCNSSAFAARERQASIRIDLDTTFIQIAAAVLAKFFPFYRSASEYAQLASAANRAFGDGTLENRQVRRAYAKFRWQVWFYSLLLERLQPTAIFVADTGEYALMRAAQLKGIRFVELQHGIFSPDHPDALPAAALTQAGGDLLLPDVLAVYGRYWRDCLSTSALSNLERIVPCGCAAIEEYRILRAAVHAGGLSVRPLRVLLTAQGFAVSELVGFIQEVLFRLMRPIELNIKLHPIYDDAKSYAILASDERVHILDSAHSTPTHQLIAESDIHLSISSACHYDALALGVPTIVLGLPGHELMRPLVAMGAARFADLPTTLAAQLEAFEAGPSGDETELFCTHGFVENLSRAAGFSSANASSQGS